MLTYTPLPIVPRLIAAIEQLEHPSPTVRDAAMESIGSLLPGITLAEFVGQIIDRAAATEPWWQLRARWVLTRSELLSPSGLEFCQRLTHQARPPSSADAQMLRDLAHALRGE